MEQDTDLQEIIRALDPTSQLLYSEAMLGKDAEELLKSDLGRTMLGMAQQDYAEAVIALANVPWWRKARIRTLQQKAANSKSFLSYMQELIIRGRQAQGALREEDENG